MKPSDPGALFALSREIALFSSVMVISVFSALFWLSPIEGRSESSGTDQLLRYRVY